MKFNHLPIPGGLYDQHPQLIDEWMTIFQIKGREEQRKMNEQERKAKSNVKGARRP